LTLASIELAVKKLIFISILAAFAVAGCSKAKSSYFQGTDVREQQAAATSTTNPSSNDKPALPPRLLEGIQSNFPGYHLPNEQELTGAWAAAKQAGSNPFLCWGDFNGDGLQDAGTLILSAQGWKFVIFEQRKDGRYEPVYVARAKQREELGKNWEEVMITAPQEVILQTVSKGATWAPEGGDTVQEVKLKFDAIQFVSKPKPDDYFASLIVFENGEYRQLFDDSLVPAKAGNSER
jgi:hypothetical protein